MNWISVKDELPKIGEYIVFQNREISTMYFDGRYWGYLATYEEENITHWMPLPEPPKEEQ